MIRALIFGWFYQQFRNIIIAVIYFKQKQSKSPRNLEPAIQIGDHLISKLIHSPFSNIFFKFNRPRNMAITIHNITFPTPITFSSFKDDFSSIHSWLKLGCGGGCLKTILSESRTGNPQPRIQRISVDGTDCLINALGLPGPGANALLDKILNSPLPQHECPIGFSIGGHSPEEYLAVFRTLENRLCRQEWHHYYYELNISCPNTPTGKDMSQNPNLLEDLIKNIRKETSQLISIKLSPDQKDSNLHQTCEIIKQIPNTMITIGNTQFRSCESVKLDKESLSPGGGGLSGPLLFPRTLEMVQKLKQHQIPMIATGGISNYEDVKTILDAGATLIGMATLLVTNPYKVPQIIEKLKNNV